MASDITRRLILLRHAKSDWPEGPDLDRPLAKRGRRDAPRIGRWLHEHGYVPDVVICSPARRTRQTWELVAPELLAPELLAPEPGGPGLVGPPPVRFEPRAYAASPLTLRFLIRELPGRYRAALLVAHNPGLSELAASLAAAPAQRDAVGEDPAGPDGDDPAGPVPAGMHFPTAAVAVFELAADWADLWPGQARLIDFTTPADLP